MRIRTRIFALLMSGLLVGGASGCSRAPEATPSSSKADTVGPIGAVAGNTYQAVVFGPGEQPRGWGDDAPRLFRERPSLLRALETSLPAQVAHNEYGPGHLVLAVSVFGAVEKGDRVEVYAELYEGWWYLDGWQPVLEGGGIYPARIRLTRKDDSFALAGVDEPEDGEGYGRSLDRIMPGWARRLSNDDRTRDRMRAAIWRQAAVWAKPTLPADLFTEQPEQTALDPHRHEPPSSTLRMLRADHVKFGLVKMPRPNVDDYQEEFGIRSSDGRFHLHSMLAGEHEGSAIEDTQEGVWYAVEAPGEQWGAVSEAVGFDPAWEDHTLFIDFATVIDPRDPTLVHYELDMDQLKVVRAIPMGPLSFNESSE